MYCTCIDCPARLKKKKGEPLHVSFFRFPKDPKIARKWLIFAGRSRSFNYKHARICSIHFKFEDLMPNKAYEMGFALKGTSLRPGAVPTLKTEEEVDIERQRVEKQMKETRKKMVDELIKKESVNPIIKETSFNSETLKELFSISFPYSNEESLSDIDNGNTCITETPNEELKTSSKEKLTEIIELQNDIELLLKRNKYTKDHEKFIKILNLKNEYEDLFAKNYTLRKKRYEHIKKIEHLNYEIGADQIVKNHLNETIRECMQTSVELENFSRRPHRLWTKVEIETAIEAYSKNRREYVERCKTECLPSISTIHFYRRHTYPKERRKYQLYCTEDTVERGVKNLKIDIETPKTKFEPLLPKLVPTAGRYIFPEETKERGVTDLLDKNTLALNDIVVYDNIEEEAEKLTDSVQNNILYFKNDYIELVVNI